MHLPCHERSRSLLAPWHLAPSHASHELTTSRVPSLCFRAMSRKPTSQYWFLRSVETHVTSSASSMSFVAPGAKRENKFGGANTRLEGRAGGVAP